MSTVMPAPAQSMTIAKVKEHIGAIVTGIDLAQPVDAATRKKLYDAVVENVVLVQCLLRSRGWNTLMERNCRLSGGTSNSASGPGDFA